MANQNELREDIDELDKLLEITTRPRLKDLLIAEKQRCEQIIVGDLPVNETNNGGCDTVGANGTKPASSAVEHVLEAKATVIPEKYYRDITNYAWDQSDKFMKIYVSLSGCESYQNVKKDNINVEFTDKSFRLKIEDLSDKNYQCHVGFLYAPIVPADSYYKLKSDSVLLMLKKKEEGKTWAYVTEREGQQEKKRKSKFDPGTKKSDDPNDSIMTLLKQMYEDGDDEMKRTIAKSWSESRNKLPDV